MRPAVPLQEDPRALVAQKKKKKLRAAVGGRAVVGNLQLAPARPVLRQEEIVREGGGVGHGERVGGEELQRRDRARARHVAADHAARRHSAARGREGAVQALAVQRARGGRPAIVSVAPVTAPMAAKLAPEAVMSPTMVKFPALTRRVVDGQRAARDSGGRAQQAHAGRLDESVAPATGAPRAWNTFFMPATVVVARRSFSGSAATFLVSASMATSMKG